MGNIPSLNTQDNAMGLYSNTNSDRQGTAGTKNNRNSVINGGNGGSVFSGLASRQIINTNNKNNNDFSRD